MLEDERHKGTFDKLDMSIAVAGSKQNYQKFQNIQKTIAENPIMKFDPQIINVSRKQTMVQHAKKLIEYHKNFQFDYFMKLRESLVFAEQMPLSLHHFMFLITLNNLCTDKQQKLFYQPALKGQILGCYAQTELGHGSDIQNLQTTATYDEQTQQFIIDSPKNSAAKWWIGDLGVYANHAIIFAQLIIKGKSYGLHSFLVPIRDKNHDLIPNVEAGDIGPKYGYHAKDNGYVKFTKYRIGREYMLMRYSKVSKDGSYTRRGNQKISYATMLIIRGLIPFVCYGFLAKGVTILTRYSLVRTQFKDSTGKQIPILDYQLQQEKVIPRIAQTFAMMYGSKKINEIGQEVFQQAKVKNIFTRLNEAHALSSGVKALFSTDCLKGLQILRRSAGGHGFTSYSGLVSLIAEGAPMQTFEGQNSILYLQTARFLLKCIKYIQKGKRLPQTCMYLEEINNSEPFVADYSSVQPLMNPQNVRKILLHYSCDRVKRAGLKLTQSMSEGHSAKQAWDYHSGITLAECGLSYPIYWTYQNFYEKIYETTKNQKNRAVLFKLLLLYGINKIIQKSAFYFESGVVTAQTLKRCHQARERLFAELRPQALSLVECLGFHDNSLHTAIGCEDGKVYERLLDWAKNKNRLNRPEVRKQLYEEWKKSKALMIPKASL